MKPGKVLMYHSLWSTDADLKHIAAEDRSYAVHVDAFAEQIRFVVDNDDGANVSITFDDGHASNRLIALPILKHYGLAATIFITTAWFGKREYFCGPGDVAELVEAGWTIGAHGHTHRFLTTLTTSELHNEYRESIDCLRPYFSGAPTMSFPGGRYGKRELELARRHGFAELFGSRPDRRNPKRDVVVPRYAIRNGTNIQSFKHLLFPNTASRFGRLAAYYSKLAVRRTLGDNNYHDMYKILKG